MTIDGGVATASEADFSEDFNGRRLKYRWIPANHSVALVNGASVTLSLTDTRPAPAAPANLTAVPGTEQQVALGWDNQSGRAIWKWQYRQQTKGATSWSSWMDIPHDDTAAALGHTVSGLTEAAYVFEVRAVDTFGAAASEASVDVDGVFHAPSFDEGADARREVPENSAAGTAVGAPIMASDLNDDVLVYSLEGADAASFEIDSSTGQIRLKDGAALNHEAKNSYSVTVRVADGVDGDGNAETGPFAIDDTIAISIAVTDVNEAPVFADEDAGAPGAQATRGIPENSGAGAPVVAPVTAADEDGDALTYTLAGTDAASFEIESASGQITVKSGTDFDFEAAKNSYAVTVTADDGRNGSDTVAIAIVVSNVNEAPAARDDTARTDKKQPVTIAVLDNDVDPDAGDTDNLTVTAVMSPTANGGTVTIDGQAVPITVTYRPRVDFAGTDRFSYTISDGGALTATATVTVQVDNDAPVAADDFATTAEGTPVTIDILANDEDANDDPLTISIASPPSHGRVAIAAGPKVTYTPDPGFHGTDKFVYTVSDDAGARSNPVTVMVTVGTAALEIRLNEVNATILPEVARTMAAATLSAITGRIEQAARGGNPSAAFSLAGRSSLYRALASNAGAIEQGTLEADRILGRSSFVLPLHAGGDASDPGGGSRLAVWGSGDWRDLSGEADNAIEWSGEALGLHLGGDVRLREDLLTGLSVSFSRGRFDYTARTEDGNKTGSYKSRMTSLSPYMGWSTPNGVDLWVTAGYGWGELEIADAAADGPETSDLTQTSFAVGGGWRVFSSDALIEGGATTLKVKGQISGARIEVEGAGMIEPMTVEVSQGRVALEASHAHKLAAGGTLTPAIELGVRNDAGDGETGTGVELGGSLRYQDPETGLTVQGHGRALLTHSGNYEEWGFGGLIRLDPGADDRGLSLSLVPAWGETQSGAQRLWNDGVTDRAANDNEAQARLETQLGYGFGVFGGAGVLTPYSGLSLAGEGARRYTLGGRLEIGPSLNLSLEAARRETAHDDAPEHGVMLRSQLRF